MIAQLQSKAALAVVGLVVGIAILLDPAGR